MKKPHRVRRRLLLPPGWVALGFLLLLGCLTIVSHWRQLRLSNVIQLTMPQLQASKLNMWPPVLYQSPKELEKYRPWHTVDLGNEVVADFFGTATTETAIRQIIADTSHAGGVRIRFWPGTTYTSLVRVLDIMNYANQKKYWLDIRHFPTTLYAITDPPTRTKPAISFSCGTRYLEMYLPPVKVGLQGVIEDFWKNLLALASPPWQSFAFMLLVINILSVWHLFRPRINHAHL
ncbi:MAG: hypothetical protein ACRYF0_06195 [Janthinobacterium lividum]